ncbi:MAG: PAS domain-containing protein [Candidatus Latescibacteria bacterium]|nr:PAS domain-containing protein [Candidatus Latescibacterota bacterium]
MKKSHYCITLCQRIFEGIVFFFLMVFICGNSGAEGFGTIFERISIEQGLSQSHVTSITQDNQGYMWIGTVNGLNKYDGYEFTVYRNEPDAVNTLASNFILSLFSDSSGNIWLGTYGGGLNKFNPSSGEFSHFSPGPVDSTCFSKNSVYPIIEDSNGFIWAGSDIGLMKCTQSGEILKMYAHDPKDSTGLSNNLTLSLYEDSSGILWIGTNGSGLDKFNAANETFAHYKHDPGNPNSLNNNSVYSIFEDSSGTLWIGTFNGLHRYEKSRDEFTRYLAEPENPNALSDGTVFSMYEDESDLLWLGTNGGVNVLNKDRTKFTRYMHNPGNPYSISDNWVKKVYKDNSGVLWFGTGRGISKLDVRKNHFRYYKHDYLDSNSLCYDCVLAIHEDSSGNIWLGTDQGGLDCFDPITKTFTHFKHIQGDPKSLPTNWVTSVIEDRQGTIWAGTGEGICSLNRKTNQFKIYRHDQSDPESLSDNWVLKIYEDPSGILWIGTGQGLDRFNREKGTFSHFRHNPEDQTSLSNNVIRILYHDRSGFFWIGTNVGLNRFDMDSGLCKRYLYNPRDPSTLNSNRILSLYEDSSGVLWVGTAGGLNRYNRSDDAFTAFTIKHGLPDNVINGILEDNNGQLWISTNRGITCFDTSGKVVKNFDADDGLLNMEYSAGACCKTKTGELYFGGLDGLNSFNPEILETNSHIPPVVITSIKKFGREIQPDKPFSVFPELTLSYKDNFISFEFAALDYSSPQKNQYAYILEGFDTDWIFSGTRRYANYTNIDPGEYIFRVKGSNNDNIWNESGCSIGIRIIPPFWSTLWFKLLTAFSVIVLVSTAYKLRIRFLENQKEKLEEQVKSRTKELNHKTDVLNKERQRLYSLLDGLPALVILQSPEYEYRYCNRKFYEELGNHHNKKCYEYLCNAQEPCEDCHVRIVLKDHISATYEWEAPNKRVYEVYLYPFSDADGSPLALKLAIDITDRKRVEEERIKKEKLEAVLETAGAAGHELNQPLQVLSGYIELFLSGYDEENSPQQTMKLLQEQVKRLRDITLKLNNITRYETKEYIEGTRIIDIDKSSK